MKYAVVLTALAEAFAALAVAAAPVNSSEDSFAQLSTTAPHPRAIGSAPQGVVWTSDVYTQMACNNWTAPYHNPSAATIKKSDCLKLIAWANTTSGYATLWDYQRGLNNWGRVRGYGTCTVYAARNDGSASAFYFGNYDVLHVVQSVLDTWTSEIISSSGGFANCFDQEDVIPSVEWRVDLT